VRRWFGVSLSLVTIDKYLRSWRLSPQKPIRKAYEQNPEAVARWPEVDYPAIATRAGREKATILWLDRTGLRSDAAIATTWVPVGKIPVVGKTGKRFGVNVMAAISNTGELDFTCHTGSFTGPVFPEFLKRLVRHLDRKVDLIVDGHPVHRRVDVRDWLGEHVDAIEMRSARLQSRAQPGRAAQRRPQTACGTSEPSHPQRIGREGQRPPTPPPEPARGGTSLVRQVRSPLRRSLTTAYLPY
jgi:hypothetical protein